MAEAAVGNGGMTAGMADATGKTTETDLTFETNEAANGNECTTVIVNESGIGSGTYAIESISLGGVGRRRRLCGPDPPYPQEILGMRETRRWESTLSEREGARGTGHFLRARPTRTPCLHRRPFAVGLAAVGVEASDEAEETGTREAAGTGGISTMIETVTLEAGRRRVGGDGNQMIEIVGT